MAEKSTYKGRGEGERRLTTLDTATCAQIEALTAGYTDKPQNWTNFTNNIPGNGTNVTITDPGAVTQPKRFYRIGISPWSLTLAAEFSDIKSSWQGFSALGRRPGC